MLKKHGVFLDFISWHNEVHCGLIATGGAAARCRRLGGGVCEACAGLVRTCLELTWTELTQIVFVSNCIIVAHMWQLGRTHKRNVSWTCRGRKEWSEISEIKVEAPEHQTYWVFEGFFEAKLKTQKHSWNVSKALKNLVDTRGFHTQCNDFGNRKPRATRTTFSKV